MTPPANIDAFKAFLTEGLSEDDLAAFERELKAAKANLRERAKAGRDRRHELVTVAMLVTISGMAGISMIVDAFDKGRPGLAIAGTLLFVASVVVMLLLSRGPIGGGS